MRRDAVVRLAVLAVSGPALFAAPALGTSPGGNGRILYSDSPSGGLADIYTANPDGTAVAQLTTDPGHDLGPAWSSNGQRIVFQSDRGGLGVQVYVMDADGSGQTRLTDPPGPSAGPSWSPDGQRIAFSRNSDIWVMDADGSGRHAITSLPGSEERPRWSPDGSRIAFSHNGLIRTVRPDGTGLILVTTPPEPVGPYFWAANTEPDWAPDGSRIVYRVVFDNDGEICYLLRTIRPDGTGRVTVYDPVCDDTGGSFVSQAVWSPDGTRILATDGRLFTVNPDGTGFTVIAQLFGYDLDWQPLPADTFTDTYVRPKGATPVRVPLVPAEQACISPNRTHGPPLAFPSCNPPQPGSTYLTVGVGDGSPAFSRSVGHVRMGVRVGAPGPPEDSDVEIRFNLTNVMRAADLSEYTGELRTEVMVRHTDVDPNSVPPAPRSTAMDFPFGFTVPCFPTPASSADASTCETETSVNALIPGAIKDTRRSIWALDALRVYDGGPDEDADTDGDNSLFATQGVFVP